MTRLEPIVSSIFTKEALTAIVILFFLFARDLGFYIQEDTKLQTILVVTIVGGAIAGVYARNRSTPTASPALPSGTTVTTTDAAGRATGTTTV